MKKILGFIWSIDWIGTLLDLFEKALVVIVTAGTVLVLLTWLKETWFN